MSLDIGLVGFVVCTASILRVADRGSMFLQNTDTQPDDYMAQLRKPLCEIHVLMTVNMKMAVILNTALCIVVEVQCFRGAYCLSHWDSARCNIPEDCCLQNITS
jgi:hypothetical protein